jgi:hypothetical protein
MWGASLKGIRSSAALLGLTSLAVARNARAVDVPQGAASDTSDTPIGVAYDAPSHCPDASLFIERVRARTADAELVPDAEVARFAVIVSSTDMASSARIRFTGADAQPATRTVSGRTCDEVVSAAALITALAIEATRSGAPPEAPEPAEPPRPNPPARDAASSPPREVRSTWLRSWGIGAMGGFGSSMPGGGYLAGVLGEIAAGAPLDLVRLTLRGTTGSTSVDARSASFTALMARLSLCPLSLRMAEPLLLVPCAGVDVGRLAGRGEPSADLSTPRSAAIFWSSAGAEVLVRWQLGSMVVLEAGGELEFPLVRHTFVFDGPTRLVYDVPAVGVGAHAGLVMRFH